MLCCSVLASRTKSSFLINGNRRHCSASSSGNDRTVSADSSLTSLDVNVAETNLWTKEMSTFISWFYTKKETDSFVSRCECQLKQRKEGALPLRHATHLSVHSLSFPLTQIAFPCFKGHCLCIHTSDLMSPYVESMFPMASFMFLANAPPLCCGPSSWSMADIHTLWMGG